MCTFILSERVGSSRDSLTKEVSDCFCHILYQTSELLTKATASIFPLQIFFLSSQLSINELYQSKTPILKYVLLLLLYVVWRVRTATFSTFLIWWPLEVIYSRKNYNDHSCCFRCCCCKCWGADERYDSILWNNNDCFKDRQETANHVIEICYVRNLLWK